MGGKPLEGAGALIDDGFGAPIDDGSATVQAADAINNIPTAAKADRGKARTWNSLQIEALAEHYSMRLWLPGQRRVLAMARSPRPCRRWAGCSPVLGTAPFLVDGLIASTMPGILIPEAGRLRLAVLVHISLGEAPPGYSVTDAHTREAAGGELLCVAPVSCDARRIKQLESEGGR